MNDILAVTVAQCGFDIPRVSACDATHIRCGVLGDPAGEGRVAIGNVDDVATREWVFRKSWDVAPGGTIPFTPDGVGRWRVRANFSGTDDASPSGSGEAIVKVVSVTP